MPVLRLGRCCLEALVVLVCFDLQKGKVAAFLVERGETLTFESDLYPLGLKLVFCVLELGLLFGFFKQGRRGRRELECRALCRRLAD